MVAPMHGQVPDATLGSSPVIEIGPQHFVEESPAFFFSFDLKFKCCSVSEIILEESTTVNLSF